MVLQRVRFPCLPLLPALKKQQTLQAVHALEEEKQSALSSAQALDSMQKAFDSTVNGETSGM
jgi:hypothetical protein